MRVEPTTHLLPTAITKDSTSSRKKENISTTRKGVLPCNLSQYPLRTLHIVYNTSHAFKVKQTQYFISIGTICTGACLA
jgi:hypothetical protein